MPLPLIVSRSVDLQSLINGNRLTSLNYTFLLKLALGIREILEVSLAAYE
jgi:hypothetical protein